MKRAFEWYTDLDELTNALDDRDPAVTHAAAGALDRMVATQPGCGVTPSGQLNAGRLFSAGPRGFT